jgi:hypothetical protein
MQTFLFGISILCELAIVAITAWRGDLIIAGLGIIAALMIVAMFVVDRNEMKKLKAQVARSATAATLWSMAPFTKGKTAAGIRPGSRL